MALNAHNFMNIMEKHVGFASEDKALLKSHAEWGKVIAPMIDLAFIEQAYVEISTAAVLEETG